MHIFFEALIEMKSFSCEYSILGNLFAYSKDFCISSAFLMKIKIKRERKKNQSEKFMVILPRQKWMSKSVVFSAGQKMALSAVYFTNVNTICAHIITKKRSQRHL